jgi:hypothetical protein
MIRASRPLSQTASSAQPQPRKDEVVINGQHAAPNLPAETRSRTRVSREPHGHRQRNPRRWSGSAQKHSNCLWFQMLGVEAHSSLPHDQNDRGNLPGQGQTRHFLSHALSQQFPIELREGAGLGRRDDGLDFARILFAPKNSAIPCRDGCPIQVIPSPSSARNLPPRNPERYTCIYYI